MKQTPETASLEYFNNNSRCRPQLEEAIRTAFEAGVEWKERQIKNTPYNRQLQGIATNARKIFHKSATNARKIFQRV